ncbi:MAG: DUF3443 domain-containing protein [Ramlibacter sp.]|nr:DUF3443 domain-containing protein [Ramlibacter sp.]
MKCSRLIAGQRSLRVALAAALAAMLVACGGGGSGPESTAVTQTPVAPAPSVPLPAPAPAAPAAPSVRIGSSASQLFTGQSTTLAWSSADASVCAASGAWTGSQPTSGSLTFTVTAAGSPTYTLSCTGLGGTGSANATLSVAAANSLPITVDRGPDGASFNMPFVSVTVCIPGTAACRTVDRVLVDTGSNGLRLMASALGTGINLPAVANAATAPVGECGQFTSGFTWGAVRRADVRLGGETAAGIPVQVIGDPGAAYASVPFACSGTGANVSTVAALGANGILGVGTSRQDCGAACVASAAIGLYYSCPAGGCSGTTLPLESQVVNPVVALAVDNNGLGITLPAVPIGGSTSLLGTLTFGLGTQANNQMGNSTAYATNDRGNFTTVYKGTSYTSSFIDSGSNGLFFNDAGIPQCSTGFFCPSTPLSLSALNVSANGASGTVDFIVERLPTAGSGVIALHAAGTAGLPRTFDWGLPFFFGRTVFVGIGGAPTPRGNGPFWAY